MFATTAPAYASEVLPLALRVYFTSWTNMCFIIGQLIAAGVLRACLSRDDQWGYRIPFAIQVGAILSFLLHCLICHSGFGQYSSFQPWLLPLSPHGILSDTAASRMQKSPFAESNVPPPTSTPRQRLLPSSTPITSKRNCLSALLTGTASLASNYGVLRLLASASLVKCFRDPLLHM